LTKKTHLYSIPNLPLQEYTKQQQKGKTVHGFDLVPSNAIHEHITLSLRYKNSESAQHFSLCNAYYMKVIETSVLLIPKYHEMHIFKRFKGACEEIQRCLCMQAVAFRDSEVHGGHGGRSSWRMPRASSCPPCSASW